MVEFAPQLQQQPLRSQIRRWKLSLHNSLLTRVPLPQIDATNRVRWLHKARGRRIELILNKPGSISFNVPTSSIEARDIFGYEILRCIVAWAEDKSGVYQPVWSGPIWTAEASEPAGKLNVTCVGWEELLEHRELRNDVKFNRVTNGEMAQIIVNTANNQYANDGYGASGSAEDLLYGAGDFEDSSTYEILPSAVFGYRQMSVGMLGIGDFGDRGVAICPPTGSHALHTTSSNDLNVFSQVFITSRAGLQVEGHNVGFPVEPGQKYIVTGDRRGYPGSAGNGVQNDAEGALQVRWYDANGTFISASETIWNGLLNGTGPGGEPWAAHTQFTINATAPSTAARAALLIIGRSGTKRVLNTVQGVGYLDMVWDNIIVTKAENPGKRSFPLIGNGDDPYIINMFVDGSMESGARSSSFVALPTGGTITRQQEWASSGDWSMKYVAPASILSTGEYGMTFANYQGEGISGWMNPGKPLYLRLRAKTVISGDNFLQARIKFTNATGTVFNTYVSQKFYGVGEFELEIYIPSLPTMVGADRITLDFLQTLNAGNALTFYIDDLMLVNENPPVPFIEGATQNNSRGYNFDSRTNVQKSMGPVFTRSYTRGTKLAQILREMTEIEWGVDYDIDPISRALRIHWDNIIVGTSLRGKGQLRNNLIFGYGVPPNNLSDITENHDASRMKNRVNTQGKVGWGLAQDFDSIDAYGLHEETIPLSDVTDPPPPQASILAVYAGSEVAMFGRPFRLFTFKPKKYVGGQNVPMFGVDYGLGDIGHLRAGKNVIKIGVREQGLPSEPAVTTLIDGFDRYTGAVVEAAEGAKIWAPTSYTRTGNTGIKTSTLSGGSYAYPRFNNSSTPGLNEAALLAKYGPDWDFSFTQPFTYGTNSYISFMWGATALPAFVLGRDYHRIQLNQHQFAADTFDADGKSVGGTTVDLDYPNYTWFSKRGTTYRIAQRQTLDDPWLILSTFTLPQIAGDIIPHYIGFRMYGTGTLPNIEGPGFDDLTGGTYAPDKFVRVFGASISIDDNNDSETIDTLTTALT